MSSDSRYELLEKVGGGSFATVYRARDTELGREVAVKQIHKQYLEMPEQMERYWQEAQLLAQLQHPNVITFYDIDRERGWLIMELMQGSLADRITTAPLDLKSVRTSLAHCLRALKYLHAQGIVHGDIKLSNLMVDARKRIKVGDFGLARRVSDKDGSLLKGTTKYMAPELVSEDFGEIGPASDLYSLGFAAYELMCGPNFETLFPGLGAFGRDKQIAWMMWHAAPDRKLPEISRVLEGVPEDLALVVQTLATKDQSERYATADEALSDLQIDLRIVKQGGPEQPVEVPDNRRTIAIAAFAFSLILSLVVLFLPSGDNGPVEPTDTGEPVSGVVGRVQIDDGYFVISLPDGTVKEIKVGEAPKILLNEKTYITARELQKNDRVIIIEATDPEGRHRLEIEVRRPFESIGYITSIQAGLEEFKLQPTEGLQRTELLIRTNGRTEITLNGEDRALLEELKVDDQLTVRHMPDKELRGAHVATEIVALQKRRMEGFLRDVGATRLTIETRRKGKSELIKLPFTEDCEVTVNGKKVVNGQLLKPSDLAANDRVAVVHHTDIILVEALRQSLHPGMLLQIQVEDRSLIVSDGAARKVFIAPPECPVTINGEHAVLADLRRNDNLELTYDNTNEQNDVSAIDALRPVAANRFAILIGNQAYDDNALTRLPWTASDARLLSETLQLRYGCGPEQTLLLVDETRVRIEQAIPDWLRKTNENSEVIVFFAGHAFVDDDGQPFLAAKDFDSSRMAGSGISLAWLREQLENCPAVEKLLLLDCCRHAKGQDHANQPSPGVMLQAIQPERDPAVFRTTYAIAASGGEQSGLDSPAQQHGLFAWFLSEAYSGKGDQNQDVHLEPTELFNYLDAQMARVEIDKQKQTPVLFLPDPTPPPEDRLSPEAIEAIRNLLARYWSNTRKMPPGAAQEFLQASRLAVDEPDAQLAWGLLQLKGRFDDEARKYFEQVRLSHPERLVAYEGVVWIDAYGRRFRDAIPGLTVLCEQIRAEDPDEQVITPLASRLMNFAGHIREFAATVAEKARRPGDDALAELDEAVAALGEEAVAPYSKGRKSVTDTYAEFTEKIEAEENSNQKITLELQQAWIKSYVNFDFDKVRQIILADLTKQDE